MSSVETFAYTIQNPVMGNVSSMPYLPLQLEYNGKILNVSGLVDTGATLNVIPYQIGLQLGAI